MIIVPHENNSVILEKHGSDQYFLNYTLYVENVTMTLRFSIQTAPKWSRKCAQDGSAALIPTAALTWLVAGQWRRRAGAVPVELTEFRKTRRVTLLRSTDYTQNNLQGKYGIPKFSSDARIAQIGLLLFER